MKMIHMTVPGFPDATLEGYILDCEITLGQEKKRPAVIVCPGGGYVYCSPREGEPIALGYAARGIHAFVLRYSTEADFLGCWVSAGDGRAVEHCPGKDCHLWFFCRWSCCPGSGCSG